MNPHDPSQNTWIGADKRTREYNLSAEYPERTALWVCHCGPQDNFGIAYSPYDWWISSCKHHRKSKL